MSEIGIVNMSGFGLYIGRGDRNNEASPLANPFPITPNRDRDQSIAQFKKYLWNKIQRYISFGEIDLTVAEFLYLCRKNQYGEDIALRCYCAPKPCHGDVIKAAIEWFNKNHPLPTIGDVVLYPEKDWLQMTILAIDDRLWCRCTHKYYKNPRGELHYLPDLKRS